MQQYMVQSKMCDACVVTATAAEPEETAETLPAAYASAAPASCNHQQRSTPKWRQLLERKALLPFLLTMLAFMTCQLNGMVAIRPNLVQIFRTYGVPIDANWASVSVCGLCGQFITTG